MESSRECSFAAIWSMRASMIEQVSASFSVVAYLLMMLLHASPRCFSVVSALVLMADTLLAVSLSLLCSSNWRSSWREMHAACVLLALSKAATAISSLSMAVAITAGSVASCTAARRRTDPERADSGDLDRSRAVCAEVCAEVLIPPAGEAKPAPLP